MNGQGLSSSYPPTYTMNSNKRSRTRPRKNPHPLATRSLPQLQYSVSEISSPSRHEGGPAFSIQSAGRRSSKSKSPPHSRSAVAPDQVVPLDFSVRHSKKRSSVVAFGSNESDTGKRAAAALAMPTVGDVSAQILYGQSHAQATLNDHLRAQLQIYFALQQQQLQEQEESESEQSTSPKKQRRNSDNENELHWADLYTVASSSASLMPAENEHLPARKNASIVNSVSTATGSRRSIAVARRRSTANKQQWSTMGRVQSRSCSVNSSVSGDDATACNCECSRQQIFVNYQLFIDEHFRRSLGTKKYRELFPSEKSSRNPSTSSTDEEDEEQPLEVTLDD